MAEEDYEIDVYGDTNLDNTGDDATATADDDGDRDYDDHDNHDDRHRDYDHSDLDDGDDDRRDDRDHHDSHRDSHRDRDRDNRSRSNTDDHSNRTEYQRTAPAPHGVKRKNESVEPDERPIDPGATTALLVSELNWWNTDDDIRGWIEDAYCASELKDITFSEHKVNGKSKGQAYIQLYSQQAATAIKRIIEDFGASTPAHQKKVTVIYTNPLHNPFQITPKDGPARSKDHQASRVSQGPYNNQISGMHHHQGGGGGGGIGFPGSTRGRGGFGSRGGIGMHSSFNRGGYVNNNNNHSNHNNNNHGNPGMYGSPNFGNGNGGSSSGGGSGGGNAGGPGYGNFSHVNNYSTMRRGRGGMPPGAHNHMAPNMAQNMAPPSMMNMMNMMMNPGMQGGFGNKQFFQGHQVHQGHQGHQAYQAQVQTHNPHQGSSYHGSRAAKRSRTTE